jgi:3-hydroxybutyryl-CoA dehydrogenase
MTEGPKVVGVVGAGTMGAGIALVALQSGCKVWLCDVQAPVLERAAQDIRKRLNRSLEKGTLGEEEVKDCLARLNLSADLQVMAEVSIVIEAVPEKMELKHKIFAALDDVCTVDTILATNTSSLSVSVIAGQTRHPERVVGMHFFNPAPVMKLVELVVGEDTLPAVVEAVEGLARAWGKEPIVCKDTPGFIVNRIARNFYGESLRIVGEGTTTAEVLDVLMERGAGFRMGPFALMDLIGIDVNYDVTQAVYQAYHGEPRYRPHVLQEQKVLMGRLGRKSGRGFYRYDNRAIHEPSIRVQPDGADSLASPGHVLVVGDTPLAHALRSRVAELQQQTLAECGLVYPGPLQPWDAVGMRWRAEEVEAYLRRYTPDVVLVSVAGDIDGQRQFLQAIEKGLSSEAKLLTSLAGPSATEQASWLLHPERVAGFSLVLPLAPTDMSGRGQVLEWSSPMQVEDEMTKEWVRAVANHLQLDTVQIRDGSGGVLLRVLSMMFNEAAEVMREGIATAMDIDTGMQLGTNHPDGPMHWTDQIGLPSVWSTLMALERELGEDRYRP